MHSGNRAAFGIFADLITSSRQNLIALRKSGSLLELASAAAGSDSHPSAAAGSGGAAAAAFGGALYGGSVCNLMWNGVERTFKTGALALELAEREVSKIRWEGGVADVWTAGRLGHIGNDASVKSVWSAVRTVINFLLLTVGFFNWVLFTAVLRVARVASTSAYSGEATTALD